MGVSFKISKTGTRFRAKPAFQSQSLVDEVSDELKEKPETTKQKGENLARVSPTEDELGIFADNEVSFNLNLYRDGYSIGMPLEKEGVAQGTLEDVPKVLRPYDRASEILFSAIESGHLPGDFLDDVPCKFVNGTLVCEVRDFRSCKTEQGSSTVPTNASPVVTKVKLKMSLENVVKDIPLISDSSWTYGDLMEVESRILKALQPQLCLDPTPKLERLTTSPVSPQLKLTLGSLRRKRLRQIPEVTVTSNSKIHGKKVCIDRAPENSNSRLGDMGQISSTSLPQHMNENLTNQNLPPNHMLALRPKNLTPDATIQSVLANQQPRYPMGPAMSRSMPDQGSGSVVNQLGASLSGQEMMISYADNLSSASSSFHGKRENQDGQMSSLLNKRARLTQMGADGIPPQQMGSSVEGIKNTILARGIQYGNTGVQKYPQPVFDGVMKQEPGTIVTAAQQGMRFTPKEEQFEMDKMDGSSELNRGKDDMQVVGLDANHLDPHQSRLQRFSQYHAFMRSGIPQAAWNNVGQKEDQFQKRKSAQSPRLSTGALPQSPLSSKSGEFSSGSVGPNFGGVATSAAAMGVSQRDKSTVNSMQGFGGTQSMTSSANDSMHRRQHQAQVAANRRTNSLPKSSAMNGVGSPVSVGNMNVQVNAGSPTVGTPPMADQTMLDRFAKIEMVTRRYQLNAKKNKAENYPTRKKNTYSAQSLMVCLANASNNEDFKDEESPLSKSVINGSMNTDKIRVLNFSQPERIVQGGAVSVVNRGRSRMILSEKSSDGTVAMHYGDLEDGDILSAEDYLPTLPNARMADLLASQFSSLMQRDGWIVEDRVQQKPTRMNIPPSNPPPHASGIPPNNPGVEMQQYNDAISGQQSGEVANATGNNNVSLASSQSVLANPRNMLPPGNMSQGLLSGASMPPRPQQQLEPQTLMQPQQQMQQSQPHQQTESAPVDASAAAAAVPKIITDQSKPGFEY